MTELTLTEIQALKNALTNPDFVSGFRKFCSNRDELFTRKVRDQWLTIPRTVDEDIERKAAASKYAGISNAYAKMFDALSMAVTVQKDTGDSE